MTTAAAYIFAIAALMPVGMHVGLVMGRPWGHLTMGGRWPGVLPARQRAMAAVQALILVALILVVFDHVDLWPIGLPGWVIWPALVLTLLTTLANLATPSLPERRLWGPVTMIMSCAILVIAFL